MDIELKIDNGEKILYKYYDNIEIKLDFYEKIIEYINKMRYNYKTNIYKEYKYNNIIQITANLIKFKYI